MTDTIETSAFFECQIRAIDEYGRSGGLWIPIATASSLEGAQKSGDEQLKKQKEDSDKVQFQILNASGDVVCTLNPPHKAWVLNTKYGDDNTKEYVELKDFSALKSKVKTLEILSAFSLAGVCALLIVIIASLPYLG